MLNNLDDEQAINNLPFMGLICVIDQAQKAPDTGHVRYFNVPSTLAEPIICEGK